MDKYSFTTYSKQQMTEDLSTHLNPMSFMKIMAAYDMAEHVYEYKSRNDGSPYFFHCTRTAKILVELLSIFDSDILCAALLHDVLEDSDIITKEIIAYNFGDFTAYLVETLTKDLESYKSSPSESDRAHIEALARAPNSALIIKLAARLDNFRCLQFHFKRNPLVYIQNTAALYFPLAEKSENKELEILVRELQIESNKFLG